MDKLVISIRNYTRDNYREIVDNIKKVGFKNVFIEWYNNDLVLQNNILKYVKQSKLNIIFAHLGFQNVNSLWNDCVEGDSEVERFINDIKICKNNGINMVVIHPTYGYYYPPMTKIGLNRIRKIVRYAELNNIKIAFENLELEGYLEYIIDNIKSDYLGICFDVGHCHLFFDDHFDTEKFKDKTFLIHLHDNFKEKDEHNLPLDGNVDWDEAIKKVIALNYNGYIIIESGLNDFYSGLSLEEFYKLAYDRGISLVNLFEQNK